MAAANAGPGTGVALIMQWAPVAGRIPQQRVVAINLVEGGIAAVRALRSAFVGADTLVDRISSR
jgi:hypothetical protein